MIDFKRWPMSQSAMWDISFSIGKNMFMVEAIDALCLVSVPFHQLTADNKHIC